MPSGLALFSDLVNEQPDLFSSFVSLADCGIQKVPKEERLGPESRVGQ